jgi:enoyl-CoA hydratase
MTTEIAKYELRDAVAVITMDDGKANALSPRMIEILSAHFERAEKEAKALLLCGRPGRYSGGLDLSVMTGGVAGMRALLVVFANALMRFYLSPLPVVAACSGHALAGGCMLLLIADRRIGAQGAFKIGLNEVAIHLPLPVFGVELARDRLSKRHYTQAIVQARIYDPETAVDAGYLDSAVEPERLFDVAFDQAKQLAELPAHAFRETKRRERSATVEHIRRTLDDDIATLMNPVQVG